MAAFLMILFVILCIFLALFILIQQGKGDMGLGSLGGGSGQLLFGGSGGQDFFQKITWIIGAIFIFGALGLTILKTKEANKTHLTEFVASEKNNSKESNTPKPVENHQDTPIEKQKD